MTTQRPNDLQGTAAVPATVAQTFETSGIDSMTRPGPGARILMRLVGFAEQLNLRCARYGNPCVYDNALFPWAAAIERDWRLIRSELDAVLQRRGELPNVQDITLDARSITRDDRWKIFLLVAYGITSPPSIAHCPQTWRLLQAIPGLKTAMFSVLEPGKRLPPHRGPYNGVLRLHLGLLIPEPHERLGLRVGDERRNWREGEVLIFDDAYEHEAWNETDRPRVVLFVDFVKPLRFPANLLNRILLALAPYTPYLRDGTVNLRQWERRFHGSP